MKKQNKLTLIGIILIIISIAVLYFNLSIISGSFKKLWPVLVLMLGMALYVYYFVKKKEKEMYLFLFLATFVTVSSVPLFILALTSFQHLSVLWPGFLSALGIALLSLYLYGNDKKFILVSSIFVISASLLIWIFYSLKSQYGLVIGISILIIGATFLSRGLIKEKETAVNGNTPTDAESSDH